MTLLVPMSPEVHAEVLSASIADYARDNVTAGRWPAVGALERARSEILALLPQGLATPDHHLLEIRASADGTRVGHLWFAIESRHGQRAAFVFDLAIRPPHRRQGHARRALVALETLARELGAQSMGLHVFAFNESALALYRGLGWRVTSLNMIMPLAPS
jgi:ribosomal protein S18 acetylase RimI-like enzyme